MPQVLLTLHFAAELGALNEKETHNKEGKKRGAGRRADCSSLAGVYAESVLAVGTTASHHQCYG